MEEEPALVMSRHCQTVRRDGYEVRVHIYSSGKGDWILEVVDEAGGSTVWDDQFETDELALKEFQETLDRDGIRSFERGPS